MTQHFDSATPRFPHMLHGGDYNPEQWLKYPEILEKDVELFKKANINCVSLGIFSWANLEPSKDHFTFEWLDKIIDRLYENGIYTVLATPSGSRPQWLAEEYPEVLRVSEGGQRFLYGNRHNHCLTSPAYRERVRIIDTKLAERYANHPAVILWHISNEFSGDCHCELCQKAFREWVKDKYKTLDNLNHAWWSHFWSHTYTSWDQVHSPGYMGETSVHGLDLEWKRFVNHQTIDFMKEEIKAVKSVNPDIPATANLMGIYFEGLDYFEMAKELDVVSWDSYPEWHKPNENEIIARNDSLAHDMMRSTKKKPFLLMECTPSTTNWRSISKLKKPGMHCLAAINAIAHGADSIQYFQLRQSRGSAEKFHSAVISHTGTENTRVFREVTEVGELLPKLEGEVYSTLTPAKVAIIVDVQNKWAIDKSLGPRNQYIDYYGLIQKCYNYFWKNGICVDIVNCNSELDDYSLVIAPMLYMFRGNISDKLRSFVADGGTLVTTVFSGVVDDTDLCFLGEATKEKLSDVLGMWVEEMDSLYDEDENATDFNGKEYKLYELCELLHPTTCEVLSTYKKDFYKGLPTITRNKFEKGTAYHLAATGEGELYDDLFKMIADEAGVKAPLSSVPKGVSLTLRGDLYFIQNFDEEERTVSLDNKFSDLLSGECVEGDVVIPALSARVLKPCDKQ